MFTFSQEEERSPDAIRVHPWRDAGTGVSRRWLAFPARLYLANGATREIGSPDTYMKVSGCRACCLSQWK